MKNKELKNNYKVNSRPILYLLIGLGAFTLILFVTMLAAAGQTGSSRKHGHNTTAVNDSEETAADPGGSKMLAVVKEINSEKKQITLFDIDHQESLMLSYTGGTNITDKYGKVIAISQIQPGIMVDYQIDGNKLKDLAVSSKAWEYVGVNNFSINLTDQIFKIAATKYKYNDDLTVIDEQGFISVDALAVQDLLTVRGYEETIWSITVTRGHGTVKLKDYETYLGANITIGYESMHQITEDMEITVRQGTFNLTVENGLYSATKSITVKPNEVNYVSLSDLGPAATGQSRITFKINPFGADLYIDGELTSYANPIIMDYGEHSIEVSLGGYNSYKGPLIADSASKTIKIDLPENSSSESAVVSETDTSTSGSTDTGSTDTGSTDTASTSDNASSSDTSDDTTADNDTGSDSESSSGGESADEDTVDEDHLIYVQNPSGASVYLDGDFMCISPGSFKKVIGNHVITFIMEGYTTMSYTIDVSDDGLDAYFTFPDLELLDAQ